LEYSDIRRFAVKESEKTVAELCKIEQSKVSRDVIFIYTKNMIVESDELVKDITTDVLKAAIAKNSASHSMMKCDMNKIFVVHGHDETMKLDVARFIEKLGFESVILHEQVNAGLTIIEKFEKYSDVGFAIVLYSPCDVGSRNENEAESHLRDRQNVVFEHEYLIGKLGREKVSALVKDDIEIPSDTDGIVYIDYDNAEWKFKISKELKTAGYTVDMNLL